MKREKPSPFGEDKTMQAYFDLLPEDLRRLYLQSGAAAADVWDLHRQIEAMERPEKK